MGKAERKILSTYLILGDHFKVCFRNDGKIPSDIEVAEAIATLRPVEPAGKLAATWGVLKTR